MRTIRIVAATLAAVSLAACHDSTGNSNGVATSGTVSFSYSGARSGSYRAEGIFSLVNDSTLVKQSFAAGLKVVNSSSAAMGLLAYSPTNANVGDELFMAFPLMTGPGTVDLTSANCVPGTPCPFGIVAFGTDPNASQDNSQVFFFSTGSLNVTAVANGRMQGTFSGTAETLTGDSTVTVTNGSFDVPLLDQNGHPVTARSLPVPPFVRTRLRR